MSGGVKSDGRGGWKGEEKRREIKKGSGCCCDFLTF